MLDERDSIPSLARIYNSNYSYLKLKIIHQFLLQIRASVIEIIL